MNSKEYKLLKKTPETCSLLSCLFLRYVQVCTQLQHLRKIGEIAKICCVFFPVFQKEIKTIIKQSTAISRFGQNTEANVESILSLSLTQRQGDQGFTNSYSHMCTIVARLQESATLATNQYDSNLLQGNLKKYQTMNIRNKSVYVTADISMLSLERNSVSSERCCSNSALLSKIQFQLFCVFQNSAAEICVLFKCKIAGSDMCTNIGTSIEHVLFCTCLFVRQELFYISKEQLLCSIHSA